MHCLYRQRHNIDEHVENQVDVCLPEYLTTREQDLLRLLYAKSMLQGVELKSCECFFDISQSIGRVPTGWGVCPCICPNGRIWSTSRGRLLAGREKMALQGLLCGTDFPVWESFPDRVLSDLAGNAFSTTV